MELVYGHKLPAVQGANIAYIASIAALWQNVIVKLQLLQCDRLGKDQSSVCHSTACVCTVIQMFTSQIAI